MIDKQISTPGSRTGATINLVTSVPLLHNQCEPCDDCRPLCDTDVSPECSPDCTCAPDCEEHGKEYGPEPDQHPSEEDQYCEPNT
jgi:hypothetical protein